MEAGTTVEVGAPLIEYNGNGAAPAAASPASPANAPLTKTTSTGHILAMPSVRHMHARLVLI